MMKPISSDTHPKIHEKWISLMRGMSVSDRFSRVRSLSRTVIELSRRAIRRAHPDWDERRVDLYFVEIHYGKHLAEGVKARLDGSH